MRTPAPGDMDGTPPWPGDAPGHAGGAGAVDDDVDVLVVGAGLAGLSTAWHIVDADPAARVLVLEAGAVGDGASGRSTGVVGPGVGRDPESLARRVGTDTARTLVAFSREAVDTARSLMERARIACDAVDGAHLVCAATALQEKRLRRQWRWMADAGMEVEYLTGDALAGRAGHGRFRAGVAYTPAVLVNPRRLTTGLARSVRAAGVTVAEGVRVRSLAASAGRTVAATTAGPVRAARVVLATDGYTSEHLPFGRRIARARVHGLATRPLEAAERDAVGLGPGDAVTDQRTFFTVYRLAPDGRLIVGGGPIAHPGRVATAGWDHLEAELGRLFPALAGVAVTHRWSGLIGSTMDRLPLLGESDRWPGAVFTGAWSGHGLALSVAAGAVVAARVTGGPDYGPLTALHRAATYTPHLGPLQPALIGAYVGAYRLRDRLGAAWDPPSAPSPAFSARKGS